MKVSINGGTPKSSILIGVSLINNPFGDPPWLWKHPHGEMSTAMFDSQKNQARNPRDRRHWKCTGSSIDRKGGWNTESWGSPQNGCLIREHPDRKWMMTGGYPHDETETSPRHKFPWLEVIFLSPKPAKNNKKLITWWFIPWIVSGLVDPSYKWTNCPPLSHWNHQGELTHKHDSWDEHGWTTKYANGGLPKMVVPPVMMHFSWDFHATNRFKLWGSPMAVEPPRNLTMPGPEHDNLGRGTGLKVTFTWESPKVTMPH